MSEFCSKLPQMRDFHAMSGASTEQINEAESKLGLTFTQDYRDYLATFGLASVYGHELTGICNSARLNVVDITLASRSEFQTVPPNWYVVEEAHIDNIVVWQCGDGKIFCCQPNCEPWQIADSLLDYLNS